MSRGMRRPNASIEGAPRASANAARNSTASVVTLMPPAVDAEPPPMNMSMSETSKLEPLRSCMSIVAKPPDLVIIDMKRDWKMVGPASSRP